MITIVIPARNEEVMIGEVIRNIKKCVKQRYELFVIDDASTDKTAEISRKLGAKVIHHSTPYGGVAPPDMKKFKGDYIISLDADMEHHPKYIEQFVSKLKTCDCVLGARNYRSRFMEYLLEFLFRLPGDYFSGYVGIKRKWLPFVMRHKLRFVWETQWMIHAVGGNVCEVFVSASKATRPSKWGGMIRSNLKALSLFIKFRRHINQIVSGKCHTNNRRRFY